jgi:nucleoside-triphosphatase THEP1
MQDSDIISFGTILHNDIIQTSPALPRQKQSEHAGEYEMKNILFTGPPRCGKSTLIEKIVQKIDIPTSGFFTREIRERGRRVGFSINTLDQKQGVLAHVQMKSRYRVGKYGVNLADIDEIAVPSMVPATPGSLIVIDEIGKMECFSERFKKTLLQVLDSDHPVIGSIAVKGNRFIQKIKERPDVLLVTVTPKNRDLLADRYSTHAAFGMPPLRPKDVGVREK